MNQRIDPSYEQLQAKIAQRSQQLDGLDSLEGQTFPLDQPHLGTTWYE